VKIKSELWGSPLVREKYQEEKPVTIDNNNNNNNNILTIFNIIFSIIIFIEDSFLTFYISGSTK
jgi:hypothetical protein